jgi:tRNA-specific 2-thiouridylase
MNKKVIVGISGGIDSAASAYLLKKEGYEVIGVTFNFLNQKKMMSDARMVAEKLKIPHHFIHAEELFREKVIEPFVKGYSLGETPNPCMMCNLNLKFKLLTEFAEKNENAFIATGHYAEIIKKDDEYQLYASCNKRKDQSYFLSHLNQDILRRLILPLNRFESKDEVRKSIERLLPDLSKGTESQGICFIPQKNHHLFLKEALFGSKPTASGIFTDTSGKILGRHRGIHGFTIGQTRGLGIVNEKRLAVVRVIPESNIIVLDEEAALFQDRIYIEKLRFVSDHCFKACEASENKFTFKTSRWGNEYTGSIKLLTHSQGVIYSSEAVRAPAPGQTLVLYRGQQVMGGGIIKKF